MMPSIFWSEPVTQHNAASIIVAKPLNSCLVWPENPLPSAIFCPRDHP